MNNYYFGIQDNPNLHLVDAFFALFFHRDFLDGHHDHQFYHGVDHGVDHGRFGVLLEVFST